MFFRTLRPVPDSRDEIYSNGFQFLARIGTTGMEGIRVKDGRRVFDSMGPEHDCMVCLDKAPCPDHIFCAGVCKFWCCRSCFQKFQMRPRMCPTCKVVFPADMLASIVEEKIVEEAHLTSEALALDSLQMKKYTQHLEFAEDTGNWEEVVEAYRKFGDAYRCVRQYEQAAAMYEKQLLVATQHHDVGTQARSNMTLGALYQELAQNRRAIASANQGVLLAGDDGLPEHELQEAFGTLGLAYQSLNWLDRAEEMFQRQLAAACGNIDGKCLAERNLAITCLLIGRYKMAIEYFEECLTKANDSGDAALSVHCMAAFEGLGDAYLSFELPERALEMYQTQLLWTKTVGDSAKEGVACRKLGVVLQQVGRNHGRNQEAKMYLESSLAIARKRNALDELRVIYGGLGRIYKAKGDDEQCAKMWAKGDAAKKQPGVGMQARRCGNLGQSLLKQGMADRSMPEHRMHLCRQAAHVLSDGLHELLGADESFRRPVKVKFRKSHCSCRRPFLRSGSQDWCCALPNSVRIDFLVKDLACPPLCSLNHM